MKRPCEMTPDELRLYLNARNTAWRRKNPDKVKAQNVRNAGKGKRWAAENKDRMRFLVRRWRANNLERSNKMALDWKRANPSKVHASFKKWRDKNVERERKRWKEYYTKNRERLRAKPRDAEKARAYARAYYRKVRHSLEFKIKNRERVKAYAIANPDKAIRHQRCRRLAKRTRMGDPVAIRGFVFNIRSQEEVTCNYCKCKLRGVEAHIDHVVPLAKGGAHDLDNLCCACPACNLSKNKKMPEQFMAELQPKL